MQKKVWIEVVYTILLFALISFSHAVPTPAKAGTGPILVHKGYLPGYYPCEATTANLNGEARNFVLILHEGCMDIYRIDADSLAFFKDLHLNLIPGRHGAEILDQAWTVGDLNNNGRDEFIVSKGTSLALYELKGDKFGVSNYELPLPADQIAAGDINNDGKDELVLFCHEGTSSGDWRVTSHHIYIMHLTDKGLSLLWKDEGRAGYRLYRAMPPDKFSCIADILNKGTSQLVISRAQSDVSPTTYELFEWNGSGLTKTFTFKIANGTLIKGGQSGEMLYVSGPIKPVLIDGETSFLASVFDKSRSLRIYTVKIEGDKLATFEPLFKAEPSSTVGCIDLKGGQKGLIYINPRPGKKTQYRIFKL